MKSDDTDFMRIRRYVVERIATNGDQPIRFPATRELARQFREKGNAQNIRLCGAVDQPCTPYAVCGVSFARLPLQCVLP